MSKKELQTTEEPLENLQTWDKNARIITDTNFRRLCSLMKRRPELLWKNPIHANKDGTVYSGNMRYRAAQQLAWKVIPCVRSQVQMTEKQMIEEAIILNHHHGEDHRDELAEQLYALDEAGIDVHVLGVQDTVVNLALDQMSIKGMDGEEEDAAEMKTPEKPKTKVGDKYQLGEHVLLCGDATKIEDVENLMTGIVADMVFTDPPYNVDYTGKQETAMKIENDQMENSEFATFLRDAFTNLYACTREGGGIYICHADSEGLNFRRAMIDAGWLMKQCIIWVKNVLVLGRQDYQSQHEPILYGWKDGNKHYWHGGRDQTTVWQINKPTRSDDHPTMKPVELVAKAIKNSTERGQCVVDIFGGSGTTLIACEKLGRKCRIMELDPKYCDVIVSRWEQMTGEKAMPIGGIVSAPKKKNDKGN